MKTAIFRSFQDHSRSGRLHILFEDSRFIWIHSRAASPQKARRLADNGASSVEAILKEMFQQRNLSLKNKLNTVNQEYKNAQMKLFSINSRSLTTRNKIAAAEQELKALEEKRHNESRTPTVVEIDENELWSMRLEELEAEARALKKELESAEKKDPEKAIRLMRILEDLIPEEIENIRDNIITKAKKERRSQAGEMKTRITQKKEALNALRQNAALTRKSARTLSRDIQSILERKDFLEQAMKRSNAITISSRPAADFDVTRKWRPDMSWRFWTGSSLVLFSLVLLLVRPSRTDILRRSTDIQVTDVIFPVAGSATSSSGTTPDTETTDQGLQNLVEQINTRFRPTHLCVLGNDTEVDKKRWVQDLALAMAKTGKQTLLIDLDLFGSGVYRRFGCTNDTGITAYLNEQIDISLSPRNPRENKILIQKIMQPSGINGLHVIARGPDDPGGEELYKSDNLSRLIRGSAECADMVLIETPSIDHREDIALELATLCSTCTVFCRTGRTNVRRLNSFLERLHRKNPKFAVAVEG